MCAPISELPSIISTMVQIKKGRKKDRERDREHLDSINITLRFYMRNA